MYGRTGKLSGQQVAKKYHLGELLGSGGIGEVYKAQDILLRRPVAVKEIKMVEDELITMKVFYSYASEDQALRDGLEKHLGNLRRQGIITSWSNRNINAGEEWEKAVHTYLDEAEIILLLISSDFIHSDFCYSVELQRALKKQRSGQAEVLPILLRPVDWEASPFSHLPVLPTNAKPVNTWPNLDEAFVEVVKGIKQVAQERIVRKCLQRGLEWLSEGQPEKALIACEKALQISRTAQTAFAFKGDIFLDYLHRPEEALVAYQNASELEPENASYLVKMGDLLFNKSNKLTLSYYDRKEAASVAYQKASKLEPVNVSYLVKMGDTLIGEKALAAYQRASELEPTDASHFIKMGEAISACLDNFEDGLAAYRRACELKPTNASYFAEMGKFLFNRMKRYEEALAAYRRASEIDPTNISYLDRVGEILVYPLHRYGEAIDVFQQCAVLSPEWQYHNQIGDILSKELHRYEEALVAYQKVNELDPTVPYAQVSMGDIYLNHLKNSTKALAAYRQASTLDPDRAEYYVKIGDILLDYDKNYEEAFTSYRQASECHDSEPSYYEKQAETLEQWANELRNKAISRRKRFG